MVEASDHSSAPQGGSGGVESVRAERIDVHVWVHFDGPVGDSCLDDRPVECDAFAFEPCPHGRGGQFCTECSGFGA